MYTIVLMCVRVMCESVVCDLLADVTMCLSLPLPVPPAGHEEEDGGHFEEALHPL